MLHVQDDEIPAGLGQASRYRDARQVLPNAEPAIPTSPHHHPMNLRWTISQSIFVQRNLSPNLLNAVRMRTPPHKRRLMRDRNGSIEKEQQRIPLVLKFGSSLPTVRLKSTAYPRGYGTLDSLAESFLVSCCMPIVRHWIANLLADRGVSKKSQGIGPWPYVPIWYQVGQGRCVGG
ncbi:MAG TPA: hypothetical protein PJ982_02485 [Lacipirellulaceae bacterium]|nr:hypothetical protein [Lacipirellulaceae bacterium]